MTATRGLRPGGFRRFCFLPILGVWFLSSAAQLQAQNHFLTASGSWHEPSLWSTAGAPVGGQEVRIGSSTPLTVTISTGDAVSGTAFIAYSEGQTGSVIVDNARTWSVSDYLYLALGGTGALVVQGGGQIQDVYGHIANDSTSSGTATVTGTGSLWQNSYSLTVGGNGNGTLNVENGGKVTAQYSIIGSHGTGQARVRGTGSSWDNTAGLTIGGIGHGTLSIEAGGRVTSGTEYDLTYIGYDANATGEVTVRGLGSLLDANGSLMVGFSGEGTLNIQDGGKLTSSFQVSLGYWGEGSEGKVTVTGSDSSLTISDLFYIGNYSSKGILSVEAGGKVTSAFSSMASGVGSVAEATVSGPNSLWENSAGLNVGEQGTATLNVEAGGKVTVTGEDTFIGYYNGGTGTVTVTGSGSRLQNGNRLRLGYGGEGILNVADGGKVTASNVTLGFDVGSKGTLILSGSAGSRGVLETLYVDKQSTDSKLHFDGGVLRATATQTNFLRNFDLGDVLIHDGGAFIDTNYFNVTISTRLQNAAGENGGLTKQGIGRLTLTGTSTYSGVTTIEQGSLRVSGRINGAVAIKNGATLDGTGTVGAVTIERGGVIAPGNSAGTLNTGSQTWNGGGIYLWEITSTTGTAGTNGTCSM